MTWITARHNHPADSFRRLGSDGGMVTVTSALPYRVNTMLFNMGYCDDYRPFTRHSSHRRSLRNFGFNDDEVRELTQYRYDADDAQRQLGHSHLKWAAPCEAYKSDCVQCQETYQKIKSSDSALRAGLFAGGVLSHGDALFLVSLPVPMVAVRADRRGDYHRLRIGKYARLRHKKIKRQEDAFRRKCKRMWEEEGLKPHPRYFADSAIQDRKAALLQWLSDNKDAEYQKDCWEEGIVQSVVESDNAFIPRVKKTSGWRYVINDREHDAASAGSTVEYVQEEDELLRPVPDTVERMQPPLLRYCMKQLEKRLRQYCDFKFISVMEQGKNTAGKEGMYHYHQLLHVYGHVPPNLEDIIRREWFRITGNLHYEDEEGKSFFEPVDSARHAASYVSKYLSKGWFSRRQTSHHLNLKDAARDARLIEYGFLQGDITAGFKRHEDGFITYESPFTEEQIESCGTNEWVGLSIDMHAPSGNPRLASVSVVAVFRSSSRCRHPASAISGICCDLDGNQLGTIPQVWWFPMSSIQSFGMDGVTTAQVSKLQTLLDKIKYGAAAAAHAAAYESAGSLSTGMSHAAAVAGVRAYISESTFSLSEQFRRAQATMKSLPDTIAAAVAGGPDTIENSAFAREHLRLERCGNEAQYHREAVLRRRARAP